MKLLKKLTETYMSNKQYIKYRISLVVIVLITLSGI